MATNFLGARQTRSGRVFSAFAVPAFKKCDVSPVHTKTKVSDLLWDAIDAELERSLSEFDDELDEPDDDLHIMPVALSQRPPQTAQASAEAGEDPSKKNAHRHAKRKRQRDARIQAEGHSIAPNLRAKILSSVEAIHTDFNASSMPTTSTAYTARRAVIPDAKRSYTPAELDSLGFTKVEYMPGKVRPVVDPERRVITCFVDHPADSTWRESCTDAFKAMREEGDAAKLRGRPHTRGVHVAINTGPLMGQGQKEPTPLRLGTCAAMIQRLVGRESVVRLATYASAAFNLWAPRLHLHFHESMSTLMEQRPSLSPNFPKSVYPAACFNMGRHVACFKHRDILNVPYGWCAITALGNFDHRTGAHLVLWDLKLYFEFPHGTTIYVPSASVVHSNTPVANPDVEERLSFTQYFPGAILRWIDNGFKTDKELKASEPQRYADLMKWKKDRWEMGLAMFSTLDEILSSTE